MKTEEALFAGGCFWGVEHLFKQLPGVLLAESGYTGGHAENPSYEDVCRGNTGHYEAVRVVYNPGEIPFEQLAKYFFEIHDPTQPDGQGPDRGQQYLSVAFYYNDSQKQTILKLIRELEALGYHAVTKVLPASIFWKAEEFHQNYYSKIGKEPYCHRYEKKFK